MRGDFMSNQVFCNLESGVCEVNLDIDLSGTFTLTQ